MGDGMKKLHLKVTVETISETIPSKSARDLILEIAGETGYLDDYLKYNLGSAYYVELPRYINQLVEAGELEQARQDLRRCFSGEGIPDDIWSKMVQ